MNTLLDLALPLEIRWHGRGGQGAVTAAKLLAEVALGAGRHVQSFPQFGSERRGAPIQAFTRIDSKPITLYSSIRQPGVAIVLDASLLSMPPTLAGLRPGGLLLVNAEDADSLSLPASPGAVSIASKFIVATVPASRIAMVHLGRPLTNTAMLGAFIGCTGLFDLDTARHLVEHAFAGQMPAKLVTANLEALTEAASSVTISGDGT